jgi:hypothetical protein
VWVVPPLEEPGEADIPEELLDEPEEEVESLPEDDDEVKEVLEPFVAAAAVVVAARAAIDPTSPRNVAALRAAATTRERFAAWRRLRAGGAGRAEGVDGVRPSEAGAPSHRKLGVWSMAAPRRVESMRRTLDSRPQAHVPAACEVAVSRGRRVASGRVFSV